MRIKVEMTKETALDELMDEMWKTLQNSEDTGGKILIRADRKRIEEQKKDIKIIQGLLDDIKNASDHNCVLIQAAITTGYANAMEVHGMITEDELQRLNALISAAAAKRTEEMDKQRRGRIMEYLHRFGKAKR